ncbi:MAG: TonB-dependent receptor [Rhodothermales bacterium]
MLLGLMVWTMGGPCSLLLAQSFSIRGYITDASTGEALIGATVAIAGTLRGATTNTYGYFALTASGDSAMVRVQFLGFEAMEQRVSRLDNPVLRIALTPATVGLAAVTVEAEREANGLNQQTLTVADIEALPALAGETDVLKALQFLPGVQGGIEGSSGLYVRGGGPDQNLLLLDGATVYNASHLFGFFSTFNTDAISSVTLYKGGFPARYGGRLSSVVDISMREGNRQRFRSDATVGLIASRVTLEGPIRKGQSAFMLSARRTYLDAFLRAQQALVREDYRIGYFFSDFNAKLNATLSNRDDVFFSVYTGRDRFYNNNLRTSEGSNPYGTYHLQWGNITSTLRWNRVVGQRAFWQTMLLVSRFRYGIRDYEVYESDLGDGQRLKHEMLATVSSGIQDITLKSDVALAPRGQHQWRYGAQLTHHTFQPKAERSRNVQRDAVVRDTSAVQRVFSTEWAAYAEDVLTLGTTLTAHAGLRATGFHTDGAAYYGLHPRLSTTWQRPVWRWETSVATAQQFIHLLTTSTTSLPADLWVPTTDTVGPQYAWQTAVGGSRALYQGAYDVEVEAYWKRMYGVLTYREGGQAFGSADRWEQEVLVGDGVSRGVEMLVRKRHGRLRGFIGYTLAWTDRWFDAIEQGMRFPFRYDRRHDIALTLTHPWKHRIVSVAWVYATGIATTVPVGRYSRGDGDVLIYGSRNSYRMPAYHRLDVSVKTPYRRGHDTLTFGFYNLYNRRNPLFYFEDDKQAYDPEQERVISRTRTHKFSLLTIVPSISYRFVL